MKLSAVIITLNEEHNIERCIRSVKDLADEVLVLDSGSADATADIARRLGARVVVCPFKGYVAQKNLADSLASHDWILSIDADEEVSGELASSIRTVKANPQYRCYRFNRLTNYCGRWIRYCGWYPDRKLRLFDRTAGAWTGQKVHEQWKPHATETQVGMLNGDLLHHTIASKHDHFKKVQLYSDLLAATNFESGKNSSVVKTYLSPASNFISSYLLKMGFLDGAMGFQICRISAVANFRKHRKTRQLFSDARKHELNMV